MNRNLPEHLLPTNVNKIDRSSGADNLDQSSLPYSCGPTIPFHSIRFHFVHRKKDENNLSKYSLASRNLGVCLLCFFIGKQSHLQLFLIK